MLLQFGALVAGALQTVLPTLGRAALDIGTNYVTGLVSRELNRKSRNEFESDVKAALRAAANAITPTVAPGQTAVFSGGPPVGSAYRPPTLIPPSIEPPQRVLQIDPGLADPVVSNAFDLSRRPPGAFLSTAGIQSAEQARRQSGGALPQISVIDPALTQFPGATPAFALGGILRGAQTIGGRLSRFGRALDPRTPVGRQMLGAAAGGVALETAAQVGLQGLFPSTAFAPGGDPLRLGGIGAPLPAVSTQIPTGLPAVGRFQKEANGCRVQWFFWDGSMDMQPVPIDRVDVRNFKRDAIFRLDVFRGKFIKLGSRRMNPMNVRAFFRAGRRVDAGERLCRKMFSEKRKQKTGTVRRKSSKRKK